MSHEELLIHLMVLKPEETIETRAVKLNNAIRAIVELHGPDYEMCMTCEMTGYPCSTIRAIEKALV